MAQNIVTGSTKEMNVVVKRNVLTWVPVTTCLSLFLELCLLSNEWHADSLGSTSPIAGNSVICLLLVTVVI